MLDLYEKSYKMSPFKYIKWWFKRLKYVYQRARWGFCEIDVWGFMDYHSALIEAMFKYLAENHMSHPAEIEAEEWEEILLKISKSFGQWNEDLPSPAYEQYKKSIQRYKNADGSITVYAPEDKLAAWREEEIKNHNIKLKKLKEGFELLYKWYPTLWD